MEAQLKAGLERVQATTGTPAVAGILVTGRRVLAQAAIGRRHIDRADAVTLDDRFHIGSNSKAWTATLCAALIDRGLLAWHTRPTEIWPALSEQIQPGFAGATLEQLLRHTAGIPPYTEEEHFSDLPPLSGSAPEQRASFARWLLREQTPLHEPGTAMSYSNAGYAIAGAMAETAAGQSWESLIQTVLAQPLGIRVGSGWPAADGRAQPWGHRLLNGLATPHSPDDAFLPAIIAPAGDLHLSLPDYGRFLQMNLAALHGQKTLLPRPLLMRLHNDGRPGFGLGWGVQEVPELGPLSVHSGSAGTFLCLAAVAHRHDLAVALATNGGSEEEDAPVEAAMAAELKALIALGVEALAG